MRARSGRLQFRVEFGNRQQEALGSAGSSGGVWHCHLPWGPSVTLFRYCFAVSQPIFETELKDNGGSVLTC